MEGDIIGLHARITEPAAVHTVPPRARKSTFMLSTISLKKKGTWTFRIWLRQLQTLIALHGGYTFAPRSNAIDKLTRSFILGLS